MIKRSARLVRLSQGFTLIELVVAFSIMAILSTIGVASFVSYSQSQVLQQTENDLATALNTAKSLSASQVTSYSVNNNVNALKCNNGESFGGYGVRINTAASPNYFYIYIMCSGAEKPSYPPGVNSQQTVQKLPSNVSFDTAPGKITTSDVSFPVLNGGVIGSGIITIKNSLTSTGKTVTIDIGGSISQ
jgi:prepilin-type N-terminal cleavage/methylation domain-containing protein